MQTFTEAEARSEAKRLSAEEREVKTGERWCLQYHVSKLEGVLEDDPNTHCIEAYNFEGEYRGTL